MRVVRQILTVGNTLGVTLPPELLEVYELRRGAMVTIRPVEEGILIQPAIMVSPLSPGQKVLERAIARRYLRALDAVDLLGQENRLSRRRPL